MYCNENNWTVLVAELVDSLLSFDTKFISQLDCGFFSEKTLSYTKKKNYYPGHYLLVTC